MKKVFILSKDTTFSRGIEAVLDKAWVQVSMPGVAVNSLYAYCCSFKPDICIIHSSYIQGFYQIFDMLISAKKCYVVYFSARMEIGVLYNVASSPMFYMLPEEKIYGINEILAIMERDTLLISGLEEKVSRYKEKLEEDRIVRKAKMAIMKYKGCSEDEAYRMIQKKAMDERTSKAAAAKKLLSEVEK